MIGSFHLISFSNSPIGLTVMFTDECVDILMKNRRDGRNSERGGLLFASPVVDDVVVVSKVSIPNSKDRSGRHFFKPDPVSAQKEIDRQFKQKLAYIGDWHTHPTPSPTPSAKDAATIKSIFCNSTHRLNYVLMVIVGTSGRFEDGFFCLTNGAEIYELS